MYSKLLIFHVFISIFGGFFRLKIKVDQQLVILQFYTILNYNLSILFK